MFSDQSLRLLLVPFFKILLCEHKFCSFYKIFNNRINGISSQLAVNKTELLEIGRNR